MYLKFIHFYYVAGIKDEERDTNIYLGCTNPGVHSNVKPQWKVSVEKVM